MADWFLLQTNPVASENEVFENKMFLKILLCIQWFQQYCSITEAYSFTVAVLIFTLLTLGHVFAEDLVLFKQISLFSFHCYHTISVSKKYRKIYWQLILKASLYYTWPVANFPLVSFRAKSARTTSNIKIRPSPSKKNCAIFIKSPLKMMKNAFYFILKAHLW